MPCHELILIDAMQYHVHHGPLRSDLGPAAIGLRFRQRYGGGAAQINLEAAILNEDAAPDYFAGLADSGQRATAETEVHRRLALAGSPALASPTKPGGDTPR